MQEESLSMAGSVTRASGTSRDRLCVLNWSRRKTRVHPGFRELVGDWGALRPGHGWVSTLRRCWVEGRRRVPATFGEAAGNGVKGQYPVCGERGAVGTGQRAGGTGVPGTVLR